MPKAVCYTDAQELGLFYARLEDKSIKQQSKPVTEHHLFSKDVVKRLQACFLPLKVSLAASSHVCCLFARLNWHSFAHCFAFHVAALTGVKLAVEKQVASLQALHHKCPGGPWR